MKVELSLVGEQVLLRPLALSDLDGPYVSWLNDPEVTAYNSHGDTVYTREDGRRYIERAAEAEDMLVLAIVARDSGAHIGNISLQRIDSVSQSAEYAIMVGDTAYWGRGVAAEASRLIIGYGFSELKLHRIYCGTSDANIPMQKLAAKLGFREEGRRREAFFKHGAYRDILEYGLLAHEWNV